MDLHLVCLISLVLFLQYRVTHGALITNVAVSPKEIVTSRGSFVSISCSVEHAVRVSWWKIFMTKEKQRIFTDVTRDQSPTDLVKSDPKKYAVDQNFNLLLRGLEASDAGTYVCDVGEKHDEALVTVVDQAQCENANPLFRENNALTLKCSMSYFGPKPSMKVTWHYQENIFTSVKQDLEGLIMRPLVLKVAASGHYYCNITAINYPFSDMCAAAVTVQSPDKASPAAGMVNRAAAGIPNPANEDSDEHCPVIIDNTVPSVFVALLGITLIGLVGAIIYVMRYYKREINKYKQVTPVESSHVQEVPQQ